MTFAIQSPKIENPLRLITLLKGAPLSVLTLLCMAKSAGMEAVEAKWLAQYSNYSDKPITQALARLEEFGLVARTSAGWQLTVDPQQLPLLTLTAAQDPAPAPDQPDETPQMPRDILAETQPETPPESENFRPGNAQPENFRSESAQPENFRPASWQPEKFRPEKIHLENFCRKNFRRKFFRPPRSSSSSLRDSCLDSRKESLPTRSRPEREKKIRKKFPQKLHVLPEMDRCCDIHELARSRLAELPRASLTLVARTRQLVDRLAAEKNWLSSAPPALKPRIPLDGGENPKENKLLVKRHEFYSLCYSDDK